MSGCIFFKNSFSFIHIFLCSRSQYQAITQVPFLVLEEIFYIVYIYI